jgi:hypothetical protein
MGTPMERLTTGEAAVVAGVSIPQIHRIIDEKILPESLYSTAQMRTFRTDACILIAFYFETAESLTAQARVPVYEIAAAVDAGTPTDKILKSYPGLTDWQIELSRIYAKAVPPRGRPKRIPHVDTLKGSKTKKRLRSSLSGG